MLENYSSHDGETRILAFCWDQPALVESCTRLVEHISTLGATSACFITSGLQAKLLFLNRKIQAFTVKELYEATNTLAPPDLSPHDLSRLYEYDLRVGWTWLTPPFGGDSPQGESESHHLWEAERIVVAYTSLFDLIQPNVVFTWDGAVLLQKALVCLAKRRGITTYFLERGLLPDTLVVDTAGVNYGSHVAGDGWTRVKFSDPSEIEVARAKRYCEELAVLERSVVTRGERMAPDLVRERLNTMNWIKECKILESVRPVELWQKFVMIISPDMNWRVDIYLAVHVSWI